MASRVMHLAICSRLELELGIKDCARFRVGQILPDALYGEDKKEFNTHFVQMIENGGRKIFDFAGFYKRYSDKILKDELYLGYYFHLIQDAVFRIVLYYDLNLLDKRGNNDFLQQLYADYHILNSYLVDKFGLENNLQVPLDYESEQLFKTAPFRLEWFFEDMNYDFSEKHDSQPVHFTKEVADKYIDKCVELCVLEYRNIKSGRKLLEPRAFSWENKVNREQ